MHSQNANAKIAQLVEHNLAKVRVAGSSPVFRSNGFARMVESVDTKDLKSFGYNTAVRVQVPLRVPRKRFLFFDKNLFLLDYIKTLGDLPFTGSV